MICDECGCGNGSHYMGCTIREAVDISGTLNSLAGSFKKVCDCKGLSEPPKIYDGQTMLTGDTCSISMVDMKPPVCAKCGRVWKSTQVSRWRE